jgi:hypothetical protein
MTTGMGAKRTIDGFARWTEHQLGSSATFALAF